MERNVNLSAMLLKACTWRLIAERTNPVVEPSPNEAEGLVLVLVAIGRLLAALDDSALMTDGAGTLANML